MKKYIHLTLVLFIISALSGAILAVVNAATAPQIKAVEDEKRNKGIKAIFEDVDPSKMGDPVVVKDSPVKEYYIVKDSNDTVLGYVFNVKAPKAYKEINFLVGVDSQGTIVGTSYLAMTETPGLGMNVGPVKASNKAVAETFNAQFPGLTSVKENNKFTVDTISGATISSSSVVNGIDVALKYFNDNIKNK